jgi:hypothetical protein
LKIAEDEHHLLSQWIICISTERANSSTQAVTIRSSRAVEFLDDDDDDDSTVLAALRACFRSFALLPSGFYSRLRRARPHSHNFIHHQGSIAEDN